VPENLVVLCMNCHAMVHEGLLRVEGVAPHGLSFLDQEGRDVRHHLDIGDARAALKHLGSRHHQVGTRNLTALLRVSVRTELGEDPYRP